MFYTFAREPVPAPQALPAPGQLGTWAAGADRKISARVSPAGGRHCDAGPADNLKV